MTDSDSEQLLGDAINKFGEAFGALKDAACATLQENGAMKIHWQPVSPEAPGAIRIPDTSDMEDAKLLANRLWHKAGQDTDVFPNTYRDLTNDELSLLLAKAFDGKAEDGITFTEGELGQLRSLAKSRDIKAVAPDRNCTLDDLRIGR